MGTIITLPATNMEVENILFVEDFMVFQEAIVHLTILSSRECSRFSSPILHLSLALYMVN